MIDCNDDAKNSIDIKKNSIMDDLCVIKNQAKNDCGCFFNQKVK
jgi:hypothetical protein